MSAAIMINAGEAMSALSVMIFLRRLWKIVTVNND
jgi:hypothetical protein